MKYLFASLLCLFSYICHSQVYRLRAFEANLGIVNDKREEIFNKNVWVESNALVIIDLKDHKLDVYSNRETHLNLVQRESYQDDTDKLVLYYTAIDKDISEYKVTICTYKNTNDKFIATLVIEDRSLKTVMIYHLKRDD
jgi:hypothetical protein